MRLFSAQISTLVCVSERLALTLSVSLCDGIHNNLNQPWSDIYSTSNTGLPCRRQSSDGFSKLWFDVINFNIFFLNFAVWLNFSMILGHCYFHFPVQFELTELFVLFCCCWSVYILVVHQLSSRNPHGGFCYGGPWGDNSGRHLTLQPNRQAHRQVRVGCFP